LVLAAAFTTMVSAQGGNPTYKPKRINKMIELLEAGQAVYDVGVDAPATKRVTKEGHLQKDRCPTDGEH
jgi:hypothetical protein